MIKIEQEIFHQLKLTKTRSFIRRISVIETRYVTTLAVITDNTFSCAKTFARLACALSALIVAGTSYKSTQVSFQMSSHSRLLQMIMT